MTKRTIFTGAMAAFLVAGLAVLDAQGRGGRIGGLGGQQGLGQQRPGQQRMGQQRPGGRAGQGRGGQLGPGGLMAELAEVDLTPDQREKVRDILEADRAKNMDALKTIGDARQSLSAAIYGEKPDNAAIASLSAKIVDGEAAQLAREIKVRQAVAQILTAEQKAKLAGGKG